MGGTVTAMIILLAGYALLWTVFLQLDKVTGYFGNVMSQASGRAQKALSGYRSNTMQRRRQEIIEGRRNWPGGRTMRRLSLAGQAGNGGFFGRQNRARLAAAEQAMMQQSAAKRLEQEGGRMSGDDDAMALAMQRGMTADRFIREYQARTGRDGRRALADMEASFGAQVGTQAMRVSAAKARWGSVSAYNDFDIDTPEGARNMYRQMMQDAGEMVADGQMSVTDVVTAMKKNNQRADISGHSFPQMMNQVQLAADRLQAVRGGATNIQGRVIDEANNVVQGVQQATGASVRRNRDGQVIGQGPNLISNSEIDAWMRGSLEYTQSGQIVAGRTETVRILGNQMRERLNRSIAAQQQAEAQAAANPTSVAAQQRLLQTERETKRQLAALAGRYDVMAQVSPENARYMAENVMMHDLNMGGGQPPINIQQLVERYRADPEFQQYRREWASASMAGAQAQQVAAGQAIAGGQPPGQIQQLGPPNSDRWLKRDIQHLSTAQTKQGSINLYRFKYLWDDQEYVGVMAQELLTTHPDAVLIGTGGYYRVDYDMLGIPFLTYEEWLTQNTAATVQ